LEDNYEMMFIPSELEDNYEMMFIPSGLEDNCQAQENGNDINFRLLK